MIKYMPLQRLGNSSLSGNRAHLLWGGCGDLLAPCFFSLFGVIRIEALSNGCAPMLWGHSRPSHPDGLTSLLGSHARRFLFDWPSRLPNLLYRGALLLWRSGGVPFADALASLLGSLKRLPLPHSFAQLFGRPPSDNAFASIGGIGERGPGFPVKGNPFSFGRLPSFALSALNYGQDRREANADQRHNPSLPISLVRLSDGVGDMAFEAPLHISGREPNVSDCLSAWTRERINDPLHAVYFITMAAIS